MNVGRIREFGVVKGEQGHKTFKIIRIGRNKK